MRKTDAREGAGNLGGSFLELGAVSAPGTPDCRYSDHLTDRGAWTHFARGSLLGLAFLPGPERHKDPRQRLCFHARPAGLRAGRPPRSQETQGDADAFVSLTRITCREPGISQAFSALLGDTQGQEEGRRESGRPQGPEAGWQVITEREELGEGAVGAQPASAMAADSCVSTGLATG